MEYAYCRVSTREQNLDRQLKAMREAGIDERFIYCDKITGKTFDRPSYNLLVGTDKTAALLREGDLLTIYSIDRLGRDYREIRNQWEYITKVIKADIRVLDMPLLDTRHKTDIDQSFVADLVLQLLCYMAEKERLNTKERQRAGIEASLIDEKTGKRISKKGTFYGRPNAEYPANWSEYYSKWKNGEITATKCFTELGLKKTTFYKLVKEYEK